MRAAFDLTFHNLFYYIVYLCPVKNGALTFAVKKLKETSSFLLKQTNFASLVAFAFSILKFYFNKTSDLQSIISGLIPRRVCSCSQWYRK